MVCIRLATVSSSWLSIGIGLRGSVCSVCSCANRPFVQSDLPCSFFFLSSWLLNPRRWTVWRTQWQLWGKTMKGVLVPTLPPSGICKRAWSSPNTSSWEYKNSCPWQRRSVALVPLYLSIIVIKTAGMVEISHQALIVLITFIFLQELEKKFQQTAAYRSMKEILTKKNEQIKEIRKRLQRWEISGQRVCNMLLLR